MTAETDIAYDPSAGAHAFAETKSEIDALAASELDTVTGNIEFAAPELLRVAAAVKPLRAEFQSLPRFELRHSEGLERYVWATWFARVQQNDAHAARTRAKLSPALASSARERRERMLTLLEYHFGDDPAVEAPLASVRAGTGHRDLAMDLTRLAELYAKYRPLISSDPKHYRDGDEALARREARAVLTEIGDSESDPATVTYRRAWTLLGRAYRNVRAGYLYLERDDPEAEARVPPLYTLTRRRRRAAKPTPTEPEVL